MIYEPNPVNPLEILQIWTTPDGAICRSHYCWATKLIITGANTTTVNTPLPLTIVYKDWKDNFLTDESRPIHVNVTGPGKAQELVITPTNGQAEFDFMSAVTGTFKIQAIAEFPCEPAEIEVVVS